MTRATKDQTWTTREILAWTTRHFTQHGLDSPRLDAELLLADVFDAKRLQLYLDPDKPLTQHERNRFKEHVRARLNGLSVAHIVGHREFWTYRFKTPPGVFVPRPETELIVELVLDTWAAGETFNLIDLCTGSGAVGICVLAERPDAHGVAVEVLSEVADVARTNVLTNGVDSRLQIVHQDARVFLNENTELANCITCNPPYIPTSDLAGLSPEVSKYEPPEALDGGTDGLSLVAELVPDLSRNLAPGGWFFMEFDGAHQVDSIRNLLHLNGFGEIYFHNDLAGIPRVVRACYCRKASA